MSTATVLGSAGIATALLLLHYSQTSGPMMITSYESHTNQEHRIGQVSNAQYPGGGQLGNALDPLISGYFPGNAPDAAAEEMQCRLQTLNAYGHAHPQYGHGRCYFAHLHPEDVAHC